MSQLALSKILHPVLVACGTAHGVVTGGGIFVAIGLPIAGGTGVLVGNNVAMSMAIVLIVWYDAVADGRLARLVSCVSKIGTVVYLFCQILKRSVGVPGFLHLFGVGDKVVGMDATVRIEHVVQ